MNIDDYGQLRQTKHKEWGFSINLLSLPGLWRKLWGPKKSDIETRLAEAKRQDAEWEAMFSRPTKEEHDGTVVLNRGGRETKRMKEKYLSCGDLERR
jgi:hypothetical protein